MLESWGYFKAWLMLHIIARKLTPPKTRRIPRHRIAPDKTSAIETVYKLADERGHDRPTRSTVTRHNNRWL